MAKVKVKLNNAGVIEFFKSPAVNDWLQSIGDDIASKATEMASIEGAEFAASAHNASRTAVVSIHPANAEGAIDNLNNNTLLKAIFGYPKTKPRL